MSQRSVLLPKTIFTAALRISSGAERETFLKEACFDAPELRCSVEQLLAAQETLESNPLDKAVQAFSPKVSLPCTVSFVSPALEFDRGIDISNHPQIGPYKLLELLGEGGMGSVYMAEQQYPLKRKVALKLIRAGMDSSEVISRFEAERQALALMEHPNIAKVLDAGTTSSMRPYFVMELVRGVSITDYCKNHELNIRERLELFITVCRAVQHAHHKGIIHRDLKPSNILVARLDGKPVVKVIDFGVAKALNQELTERTLFTQFAQMIGTPVYMSPEQAEMNLLDVDTRSDIYSLGVLLYELLTGRTPFHRASFSKLGYDGIRKVLREEIPLKPSARVSTLRGNESSTVSEDMKAELRKLRRSLKGELDLIVMTALEKDRELRYKTAIEFAEDVQRYLDGQPIIASPPTLLYRTRKFCTRHWVALTIMMMTSVGLLTGGGIAVSQMLRAISAEKEATQREKQANDLLEASRLHQMLTAFRSKNYSYISSLHLPEIEEAPVADSASSGSLRQLLLNAGSFAPKTQYPHPVAVEDFAISPDGQSVVTACSNGTAYLWDIDSGHLLRTFEPHVEPVDAVAISPDGQVIVTGCRTGQVWAWHREEQQPLKLIGTLSTGIETLQWSPDGETLVAGARYTEFCVWDRKFKEVLRSENDHRHESFLFSEDSKLLYVPTRTSIDVWDVSAAAVIHSIPSQSIRNIRTMCWAGQNGQYIVAADRFSDQMAVLDPVERSEVALLSTNAIYPQHLGIRPDMSRLASVYYDGQCHIYNLNSIRPGVEGRTLQKLLLASFQAHSPNDGRASVVKFRGHDEVLTSGADGKVARWNLTNGNSASVLMPPKALSGLLPSGPDELLYFVGESKQPMRVSTKGRGLTQIDAMPSESISSVGNLSQQGWFPARVGDLVEVRNVHTGQVLGSIKTTFQFRNMMEISKDGTRIAVATADDQIHVWSSSNAWAESELLTKLLIIPTFGLRFADEGKTLIADHDDQFLIEWDLENDVEVKRTKVTPGNDLVVSEDNQHIAIATENGFQIRNRATDEVILSRIATNRVTSLLFCDHDRVLLTGYSDGKIFASHLPTKEELGLLYEPETITGWPVSMQFMPTGDRLLVHFDLLVGGRHTTKILILGPNVH
ncbi:protein kinase domain-containing protein [Thalassoglobus sp.]|uniref:protein kinase domain-containing protein n=1 Tax=Thalassoglobus sp. TaxID=2795869 RepID=UPI003AA87B65